MRVLFVTKPHLPAHGGAQQTVHWLALALVDRGHNVTLLSAGPASLGGLPAVDRDRGYALVRTRGPVEHALPAALDELRPAVVVVNGYDASTVAPARQVLRRTAALPTVLYVHDTGGVPLARDAGSVVAVSRFLARRLAARGVGAEVVPPIVEPAGYRVETTRRTALLVNPVPPKGLNVALRLAAARPDVSFALQRCWRIPPAQLGRLYRATRALGNVEIRPVSARPADVYGDARVLLAPSVYPEAWGRVAREAQTSGIPVIAAARGGLPEAVGEGGLLVDPRAGAGGWLAAFERVWDDRLAYAGLSRAAAREGTRTESSATAVAAAFETVLEAARDSRRARFRVPLTL
jgi:glycosyltransferase involved in cell wall biosynthesis